MNVNSKKLPIQLLYAFLIIASIFPLINGTKQLVDWHIY